MVTPWLDARPDPADLPANEVTLTAAIDVRCLDDYCPHVAFLFTWFTDTGDLAQSVNTGTVSSETWQKAAEPEPVELPEKEPPPADADPVPAAETQEAEEKPRAFIESRRFESASPKMSCTCAFVRALAVQALRVQAFMPDPEAPLPEPGLADIGSPPASASGKKKPDPKKDPKKKKDPKEVASKEPAESADGTPAGYVKLEVVIPLAPLIVQKCLQQSGRLGSTSERNSPTISEDLIVQVPCPQIKALQVSVRCTGPLMTAEIRQHLNPLLLTLGGAHALPQEPHRGQQELVYAVVEAFGERRRTLAKKMDKRRNVPFKAHLVYFLGTWPQHETREHLQLAKVCVEVHDRDKGVNSQPIVMEEPPAEEPPPKKGGKAPPQPEKPLEAVPPGWEPSVEVREVSETWCGIAYFNLSELLNPRLVHPLPLRAEVEPQRRKQRALSGGRGLQVSNVMKGDAKARELIVSTEKPVCEQMPDYHRKSTWVRVTATLAEPLAPLVASTKPADEVDAVTQDAEEAAEGADQQPDGGEEESQPTPPRYERYTRVVIKMDYQKTTVLKLILQAVSDNNVRALDLDAGQARTLASVKLTDEQKSQDLDIITGFIVMDRRCRIIVAECLREGNALGKLLEVLPEESTPKLMVLFNPDLGFSQRLYTDFNLVLKQVKLRQPTIEGLTMRPALCLAGRSDAAVSRGLNQLMEIKRADRIHVLKLMGSFPTLKIIEDIETQYGDFVHEKELHGGCVEETRSAHSKMTGRTGRSSNHSGGKHSGQGTAEEMDVDRESEHDGQGSMIEEVHVRNAKIFLKHKLTTTNQTYQRMLQTRAEEPPTDMISTNKKVVQEMSRQVKAASGERKVGPRKEVDKSFLEPSEVVYIYSGQAKNTAEQQKRAIRAKMVGKEGDNLWTYSAERNSGCFPLLEKEVQLDRMLREEIPQEDDRKPFKYPSPREVADYRRMQNQVSDARKEDLKAKWIENQYHPEMANKEIVRGAFDAQSLGVGGAHVLDLRRPCLFEATTPAEKEVSPPPMKYKARNVMGLESAIDKHHRSIRDGEPEKLGLRFAERRPPRAIRRKFGHNEKLTERLEVENPPISYQQDEEYREDKGTCESLSDFMNAVRRPVELHEKRSEWNHSQHLNSLRARKGQTRAWQDATRKTPRQISFDPQGALTERGSLRGQEGGTSWNQMRQVSWKPDSDMEIPETDRGRGWNSMRQVSWAPSDMTGSGAQQPLSAR